MKSKYTFLLLFFSCICFSQKNQGIITLIDGTTISGQVKVTKNGFKYKESEDSEAVKYDFTKAKEAEITDKKGVVTKFEFIVLKEGKEPDLLQVVIDGYLRLYTDDQIMFSGPTGGGMMVTNVTYYVKRKNDAVAQYYKAVSNLPKIGFKKVVESYFTDCPQIQQKFEAKEFRPSDFVEIVNFYNTNCAPKP